MESQPFYGYGVVYGVVDLGRITGAELGENMLYCVHIFMHVFCACSLVRKWCATPFEVCVRNEWLALENLNIRLVCLIVVCVCVCGVRRVCA